MDYRYKKHVKSCGITCLHVLNHVILYTRSNLKEKIMNNIYKYGFTLAEVLITLAIVGVIATMTLPGLINKTNNAEAVVGVKKAYMILSQAAYMIKAENGGNMAAAFSKVTSNSDHEGFANIFIPKLHIQKNCGTNQSSISGCFTEYNYKNLINGSGSGPYFGKTTTAYSTILTSDGMSYAFNIESKDCDNNSIENGYPKNVCGYVYVDINGPNKGSATAGRDLFMFYITNYKNGIIPAGIYPAYLSYCKSASMAGYLCTAGIVQEGAMNY